MKIELKKIEFSERMSQETNCFVANLYINGKHVGEARNEGFGGPTDYTPTYSEDKKIFARNMMIIGDAERYCASLPRKQYEFNGHVSEFAQSLETVIDDLFTDWLKARYEKKMQGDMKKGILVGSADCYSMIYWKSYSLEFLCNNKQGRELVKNKLAELKREGRPILNTNIPAELYPTE